MTDRLLSVGRIRNAVEKFVDPDLTTVVAAYNAYEVAQAADTTKTVTVSPISFFYDGTNYIIIAMASYPEIKRETPA